MKLRIAVLFGGKSVEHEVSIISAIQAIYSMDTEKYEVIPVYLSKQNEMFVGEQVGKVESYQKMDELLSKSQRVILVSREQRFFLSPYPKKAFGAKEIEIDLAFPIVHGTNVEDGTLQGYLKTVGIPFVGCDVTASAVGMDKYVTKAVLLQNDIPVLPCLRFTSGDYAEMEQMLDKIEKTLGYPVIVKPANLGSSVGIAVAKNREELVPAIDDAFLYAKNVLVEHAILQLREINCAVLGDENEAIASVCEEPLHGDEILSYEDKYLRNGGKGGSKGMASVSRKIPAELSDAQTAKVKDLAVRAFQCLGCNGVARIDFMIDEQTDTLYFNEINTIPGSLSFYLWEPAGIPYPALLDRMIALAQKRSREERALTFSFETNILSQQSLSGVKGSKGAKR